MKLSKKWTKVTPLSKTLALALLVILPFIGVFVGYELRDGVINLKRPTQVQNVIKVPISDTPNEIIRRCGDFSREELGINYGPFTMIDGPAWSPDCRHIAWSTFNSGIDYITVPGGDSAPLPSVAPSPQPKEGLYLFDDRTKKIQRIITPESPSRIPIFSGWKDASTIVFTRNGERGTETFQFDLYTKQISPQ